MLLPSLKYFQCSDQQRYYFSSPFDGAVHQISVQAVCHRFQLETVCKSMRNASFICISETTRCKGCAEIHQVLYMWVMMTGMIVEEIIEA